MLFSIIVVSLNPGEKLNRTIKSILEQSYKDYEVIVKDGMSSDGSIENIIKDDSIKVFSEKDKSIYDGMNQAISYATGEYLLFLNCGDLFENEFVLENVSKHMGDTAHDIYYGDMKRAGSSGVISWPSDITDFVCYRNIPCHQVCFYKKSLFSKRGYDLEYPVRADYEHFLWCKYSEGASFMKIPVTVCLYEGEGFSETKDNEKKAAEEHRKITKIYLGSKCILYKAIMIITLQPLRKAMAESKLFSGFYHGLKGIIYGK